MINEYIKSFDHERGCWGKKSEAVEFGDFFAHEIGINRKGVVWEKDGKQHRLRIPLITEYWHPSAPDKWEAELERVKHKVKTWLSD